MNIDQAIALMRGLLENAVFVAGPLLGAALVGGVIIGILQTATQVNEMSVAFVVKAPLLGLVFIVGGAALADQAVRYTPTSFSAIADVVH